MIFQSFTFVNFISLCMKILNSVVVVGLYYGFMTTLCIGPSYLFLLRARALDENQGTEKKAAATAGFLAGQLMTFVSIFYAPFHVALNRPHARTFLTLPYLLSHFFLNNQDLFDIDDTARHSMRNFGNQCIFMNNCIFPLLNHTLFPSAMVARLVNIYIFRCNNTMLFVTSSFFGWLIGHILFMQLVGFVVVWIKKNYRSNILFRSKKYQYHYKFFIAEWRYYRPGIVNMILVISCIWHIGRMPAPFLTYNLEEVEPDPTPVSEEAQLKFEKNMKALNKTRKYFQRGKGALGVLDGRKEKRKKIPLITLDLQDVKKKLKEGYYLKQENADAIKKHIRDNAFLRKETYLDFFKKRIEDYYLLFEKPFVTDLFDYHQRSRPNRYIKNERADNAVRNEMSEFYFFTCLSDGKERISFTYPPSLPTFLKMIKKIIPRKKASSDQIPTCWSLINEEKKENLKKEFLNRIEALDTEWSLDKILEKTTRFCHNETNQEYLPKIYDPFLYGIDRGRMKWLHRKTRLRSDINRRLAWINKIQIHFHFLCFNSENFYHPREQVNRKSFQKKLSGLSKPQEEKRNLEKERKRKILDKKIAERDAKIPMKKVQKFLFDATIGSQIRVNETTSLEVYLNNLPKIKKKVPRWRYKFRTELDPMDPDATEGTVLPAQIRSKRSKYIVFWTGEDPEDPKKIVEDSVILSADAPDYRRELIYGSMRAQRRKAYIWGLYHPNVHSRVFFDRLKTIFDVIEDCFYFFVDRIDIRGFTKKNLRNWKRKRKAQKLLNEKSIEELKEEFQKRQAMAAEAAENEEREAQLKKKLENQEAAVDNRELNCVENEANWAELQHGIQIRTALLFTMSFLRRSIFPPVLITIKNCIRILLRKVPEWSEDVRNWKREVHFLCNSTGGVVPKGEFPTDWYDAGIQIKVVYPFHLKPSHKSKLKQSWKARLKKTEEKLKKNREDKLELKKKKKKNKLKLKKKKKKK